MIAVLAASFLVGLAVFVVLWSIAHQGPESVDDFPEDDG